MGEGDRPLWAVGLMSGTSLDGIDAALIRTDGETIAEFGPSQTTPYPKGLRARLAAALGKTVGLEPLAAELTRHHEKAVRKLLAEGLPAELIGFHGHTVDHRPQDGLTLQIGDGAMLAGALGIPVVCDFRSADVAAGGEGAPFASLFHQALARSIEKPVAVLNVGGIANVTWIDEGAAPIAFDTGPGNGLIDQWVERHTGKRYDKDGRLAASGTADEAVIARYLANPYYDRVPPKSLDRLDFDLAPLDGLSPEDGAATLVEVTVRTVARALDHLPVPPLRWLVTGGGRHNPTIMARMTEVLGVPCLSVESEGWSGDALEAQAFAYLAVRSIRGLPLSLPTTTGVAAPMTGGRLFQP